MRLLMVPGLAVLLSGCAIERVGPPGVVMTRAVRVKARDVKVFASADMVKDRFVVVDDVFVKDNGDDLPREMESRLRVMAGARGANAIILHPLNRRLNGTRVVTGLRLDNPFEYFRATAIWIGNGRRPEKYLGTLGSSGG
jgi:hypothetical protein